VDDMGDPPHRAPEDTDREPSALDLLFEGDADPVAAPQPSPPSLVPTHPEHPDA
jgi:hypothetical protein